MLGCALLLAIGAAGWFGHWQPLTLGMGIFGALLFTAIWEWGSLNGGWQRWAPGLGRLFGADPDV